MIESGLIFAIMIIGIALGLIMVAFGMANMDLAIVICGFIAILSTILIVGYATDINRQEIHDIAVRDLANNTVDITWYTQSGEYQSVVNNALKYASMNGTNVTYNWVVKT